MTRAPETLLAVRRLLLDHLNVDPNSVRNDDLEPAEVGIVGDANHRGGYHCGSDRVVPNDYSVVESTRDSTGLTLDAAALDVGQFTAVVGGHRYDLPHFSAWTVSQCAQGALDTRDIREVIYSLDGRTVVRWDRLGRRRGGDDSHRWHTHFSFFRDAIRAGRDQRPLFRRYLTTIGLIREGVAVLFCEYGDSGPAVKLLQYRLLNSGFREQLGAVDGRYGDRTVLALRAAMAALGVTDDGRVYGPEEMMRLDILVIRRYAAVQGPPGPAGPPGPKGDPGTGVVDVDQVAAEALRRMGHLLTGGI